MTEFKYPLSRAHFDNGRTIKWGDPAPLDDLCKGEIFTLLDAEGLPVSKVLRDRYGTIREKPCARALANHPELMKETGS